MVFDSVERFVNNASAILWVKNNRNRNDHLVYVPGLTTSDIMQTFVNNGYEIDHVNFLMHETDNSIELVTSFMFTPQACNSCNSRLLIDSTLESSNGKIQFFTRKNMKISTGAN